MVHETEFAYLRNKQENQMRKTTIVAAAVALCASAAYAEDFNVKVYGQLDGGIGMASNQSSTNSSPQRFVSSASHLACSV